MPKFLCKCGFSINLSNGTTDYEFTVVPEKLIDLIGSKIENDNSFCAENFYDLTISDGITMYKCPSCKRIYLEENGENNFTSYIPEK